MSKQLVNFSNEHLDLLKRFLSFFNIKKEQCNKQVSLAIRDVQEEYANAKLVTQQELGDVFEKIRKEVDSTVRFELETFYRMSGVFIQMLMFTAEEQNSVLKADVNHMENYKALEEIKEFENLDQAQAFALTKKATQLTKLPTLGASMSDPNTLNQLTELKKENESLKKQIAALQQKMSEALKNKDSLNQEASVEMQSKEREMVDLENKIVQYKEEKEEAVEKAENLRKELFQVRDELKKKVSQLTQVTNMKKMIQDKNEKIKELRGRLGKYEAIEGDE